MDKEQAKKVLSTILNPEVFETATADGSPVQAITLGVMIGAVLAAEGTGSPDLVYELAMDKDVADFVRNGVARQVEEALEELEECFNSVYEASQRLKDMKEAIEKGDIKAFIGIGLL